MRYSRQKFKKCKNVRIHILKIIISGIVQVECDDFSEERAAFIFGFEE
jgi:hypothetical protein